eukprot:gnl/Spiro4/15346_TR8249_c0_g1_i1.p1 gnl/Spiro4/15346_TR8249_c0_g1~~gnl/Spiro4/15346_TR8249_c0_g1_i1.p1  ORF type:complete len:235 (+),score=2.26 gnl/Spiro4/15346_TR8249_c0_g1_i1:140-844(+)
MCGGGVTATGSWNRQSAPVAGATTPSKSSSRCSPLRFDTSVPPVTTTSAIHHFRCPNSVRGCPFSTRSRNLAHAHYHQCQHVLYGPPPPLPMPRARVRHVTDRAVLYDDDEDDTDIFEERLACQLEYVRGGTHPYLATRRTPTSWRSWLRCRTLTTRRLSKTTRTTRTTRTWRSCDCSLLSSLTCIYILPLCISKVRMWGWQGRCHGRSTIFVLCSPFSRSVVGSRVLGHGLAE